MKRLPLIIGHSHKHQGAKDPTTGITEFQVNQFVAEMAATMTRKIEVIPVYRKTTYYNLPFEVNKIGGDLALSLHCNAFNRKASGTLTLTSDSTGSLKMASIIHPRILSLTKTKDRGIVPRMIFERGGWILHMTKMPCLILEPFFIDNDLNFENNDKFLRRYAEIIIESSEQYFGL